MESYQDFSHKVESIFTSLLQTGELKMAGGKVIAVPHDYQVVLEGKKDYIRIVYDSGVLQFFIIEKQP